MTTGIRRILTLGIASSLAVIGAAAVPLAASASTPTQIAFESTSPIEVDFGESWVIALRVLSTVEGLGTHIPTAADGTVDVYLSGISGPYVGGLAAGVDGRVYVSQPDSLPLLTAGDYDVSAIFTPTPGNGFATSQTVTPLWLSVRALSVEPTVTVSTSVEGQRVITAELAGDYREATGQAPAGTWSFVVSDADGSSVFDTAVAQQQGATEPTVVVISTPLKSGQDYTLT